MELSQGFSTGGKFDDAKVTILCFFLLR